MRSGSELADVFLSSALVLTVAFASIPVLLPVLRRLAMDVPVERSSHTTPVPRGAGVAVVLAVLLGSLVSTAGGLTPSWPVVSTVLALAAVGLWEDVRGVPIVARLVCQLLIAVVFVVVVVDPAPQRAWGTAAAVILLVGYPNVFNFMDGINGISGLTSVYIMGWFAALAISYDVPSVTATCCFIAAGVIGFLPWNIPQARVFLGDSGSYGLGVGIVALATLLVAEDAPMLAVVSPLTVYVADSGWTLAKRVVRKERWYEAHREHVYQRLADRLGHLTVSVIVVMFSAAVCASWLVLWPISDVGFLLAAGVIIGVYLALPALLGSRAVR